MNIECNYCAERNCSASPPILNELSDPILDIPVMPTINMGGRIDALSIIAHDFRGPLANLSVLLEMIDTHNLDPNAERISHCTRRAMNMIDGMEVMLSSLLEHVKTSGDPLCYSPSDVNINDVVEKAMALNQPVAEKKLVRLHCYSVEPLGMWGDEQLIFQAVENLVNNAVKHSKAGETVMLEAAPSDGQIVIKVSDEGSGMSKADLIQAFRPFTRLSSRPLPDVPSAGLGLWIVKLIAERHGGSISADSGGVDGGSVFALRLPI